MRGVWILVLVSALAEDGVGESSTTRSLWQSDFDSGTVIIDKPGRYVLEQDVVFRPPGELDPNTPETWMFPDTKEGSLYSGNPFRLGFFAGLVIAADNVVLDLAGHELSQSEEHALMQRFFSLIELANSPFPPGSGPAAFVSQSGFKAALNVTIENGRLGRSSHHGIHGNNNKGVVLRNLEIRDFEVAGISLNKVDNLIVENVEVHRSRMDVPANGRLSNAIFLLQAVSKHLKIDTTFDGGVAGTRLAATQAALRKSVHEFLVDHTKDEDGLFASSTNGLPDASMVAGVIIHANVNVDNFLKEKPAEFASNIRLQNLKIHDLFVNPGEMGALFVKSADDSGLPSSTSAYSVAGAVHDPIGAVFDVDFCSERDETSGQWKYKSNKLAEMQLALGAYAYACQQEGSGCTSMSSEKEKELLGRNTISAQVVQWADGQVNWSTLMQTYTVRGNHDVMFHRIKGLIGLKLDGVAGTAVDDVIVYNVNNVADFSRRSKLALAVDPNYQYSGFFVRGVTVTASEHVGVKRVGMSLLSSKIGDTSCLDALHDFTNVTFADVVTAKHPKDGFSFQTTPTSSQGVDASQTGEENGSVKDKSVMNASLYLLGGLFGGLLLIAVGVLAAKISQREQQRRPRTAPSSNSSSKQTLAVPGDEA